MPLRGSQPAGFGSPPGGLNANVRAARLRLPTWPLRCQGPAPALLLTSLPSQMAPRAPWILLGPPLTPSGSRRRKERLRTARWTAPRT